MLKLRRGLKVVRKLVYSPYQDLKLRRGLKDKMLNQI